MTTKTCSKCNKEYPATTEYFYKNKASKDGLHCYCKNCQKEYDSNRPRLIQSKELQEQKQKTKSELKTKNLKLCPKCNNIFPATLEYFYSNKSQEDGLSFWCKHCSKQVREVWTNNNYDTIINKKRAKYKENIQNPEFVAKQKQYDKIYYEQHKEHKAKYRKKYRQDNLEKELEHGREYYKQHRKQIIENNKKYYIKNKERIKQYNIEYNQKNKEKIAERDKQRHNNNKLGRNFSAAICHALKGNKAGQHWEDLVPYTLEQLRTHLESQFTPEMNWNNYGDYWEVDHIIPQNVFNYTTHQDRDFQMCWSLANLRPLEKCLNRQRPKDGSDIPIEIKENILRS